MEKPEIVKWRVETRAVASTVYKRPNLTHDQRDDREERTPAHPRYFNVNTQLARVAA